jgi:hypothetical protein
MPRFSQSCRQRRIDNRRRPRGPPKPRYLRKQPREHVRQSNRSSPFRRIIAATAHATVRIRCGAGTATAAAAKRRAPILPTTPASITVVAARSARSQLRSLTRTDVANGPRSVARRRGTRGRWRTRGVRLELDCDLIVKPSGLQWVAWCTNAQRRQSRYIQPSLSAYGFARRLGAHTSRASDARIHADM